VTAASRLLLMLGSPLPLSEGEPVQVPPWEARQWVGFSIYALLLLGLVLLAWRLARPEKDPPERREASER
jgi:hypothetical protein